MAGCSDKAERERCDGVRVPVESHRRHAVIFWQDLRGKHQEQLRPHLRTA